MDNMADEIQFINDKSNEDEVFIMKPYSGNQGKGLEIID